MSNSWTLMHASVISIMFLKVWKVECKVLFIDFCIQNYSTIFFFLWLNVMVPSVNKFDLATKSISYSSFVIPSIRP
jgi:hypothetical protein